MKYSGWV